MNLDPVSWATPWAALLLLAPLFQALLARRARQRLERWAEPHLHPWALEARPRTHDRRRWLAWPAWALLALAAAGPRQPLDLPPGERAQPRHDLTLMALLDVSASMAAADTAPTRLERARLELTDLSRRLRGERIGLLLYAGEAGLLLPPSDDPALFARALAQAGPDLLEKPGTNLAAALALALPPVGPDSSGQTTGGQRSVPQAVLLLTDAETGSLTDAARAAAQRLGAAHIPLYILGLGTEAGAPIPLPDGGFAEADGVQVQSRADPAAWRALARASGGEYVPVQDGDGDWAALYDQGIARLPGRPVPAERARAWRRLHHGPLAAALLLFAAAWWPSSRPRESR
ncbi:MAG: VWA domain-containing protein [Betaproteobacteria bacterium]|nr:VWA domain-containing protein [Betaproteobacteria bacterium]